MSDFWSEFEQVDREESGGGGIVGLVNVRTGYKVYASGADQEESFFDAPAGDKAARAKAKAAATLYANEHGANQARWSILLHMPADSAIRMIDGEWQGVTWEKDRYFVTNTWTDACKQVVVPSLKTAGVTEIPCSIWCRVGFQPDPYKLSLGEAGKTDTDQDGNARYPQVAYITERFDSFEAAKAAVGMEELPEEMRPASRKEESKADDGPALPVDWAAAYPDDPAKSRGIWLEEMEVIKKEVVISGPMPKVKAKLEEMDMEENHSCTVSDVLAWWNEV